MTAREVVDHRNVTFCDKDVDDEVDALWSLALDTDALGFDACGYHVSLIGSYECDPPALILLTSVCPFTVSAPRLWLSGSQVRG
jgi:hypothetical protein